MHLPVADLTVAATRSQDTRRARFVATVTGGVAARAYRCQAESGARLA